MVSLDHFIEATNAAESSEAVFKHFSKALSELGYDKICYSLITDHPSLGLKAGHGVLRNYSESWMKHYMARGYVHLDPVPKYCFSTNRPFSWDWLTSNVTLSDGEALVMNEAREEGLLSGLAVPLYGVNSELAGVGLASSAADIRPDARLLAQIQALAFQFHIAYTDHEAAVMEHSYSEVSLTSREREILLWAAEGKSDQIIADIIGVSYPTVRFHMNNIFKKLDANERVLAVVKAIRLGLILPSYVYKK